MTTFKRSLAFVLLLALLVIPASAQVVGPDFSTVDVDLTSVYTLAGLIGAALVGMIAVRKGIKLFNRS